MNKVFLKDELCSDLTCFWIKYIYNCSVVNVEY